MACASILCRLKRTVPPHAKIRDKRFLAQSVDAVLKGVLSSYPFADLVRFNDEEAFLFFDRQAAVSRKAAGKEIEKILALLRHKAELLLNVSIFFGVSHIFSGPGGMPGLRQKHAMPCGIAFFLRKAAFITHPPFPKNPPSFRIKSPFPA